MQPNHEQDASMAQPVSLAATMAHERAVTMQDIADQCGVSLITVSRALRGDTRVKNDTLQRIQEIADMLGYNPDAHHAARRLALRKHGIHVVNHVIALFLQAEFSRANYFVTMFRGVMEMATSQGFALLTADPNMPEPLPIYARGDVDGLIILGWTAGNLQSLIAQITRSSAGQPCPVIAMLSPVPGCSNILTDDRAGAYAATAHLLDLGHRHLLHFWKENPDMGPIYLTDERRAGCRQAYLDRGLDPDEFVHAINLDFSQPYTRRMHAPISGALAAYPEITGILLPNDAYASQAREVLRGQGLRIPEDISLVGFDDAETLPDEFGRNILTTIRIPLEDVGRTAAELVIKQAQEQAERGVTVVLPTELIVRSSTAAR